MLARRETAQSASRGVWRAVCCAGALAIGLAVTSCGGINPPPPVTPLPANATGLRVFLAPGPNVAKLVDPVGRPLVVGMQHDLRDVLEESGFSVVSSPEAADGLIATLSVETAGAIHADLFIHGAEACGVHLSLARGSAVLANVEPEARCVATSAYYGLLSKDAVVAMVNLALRAPAFKSQLPTLVRPGKPASPAAASASAHDVEERPQ